jgi:hypothetical protein
MDKRVCGQNVERVILTPKILGLKAIDCQVTYGKDPTNLLVRTIMYNLGISKLSKKPMGQVIIPVGHLFTCGLYGTVTKTRTGLDTIITCIKGVCPKYENCHDFMAQMPFMAE